MAACVRKLACRARLYREAEALRRGPWAVGRDASEACRVHPDPLGVADSGLEVRRVGRVAGQSACRASVGLHFLVDLRCRGAFQPALQDAGRRVAVGIAAGATALRALVLKAAQLEACPLQARRLETRVSRLRRAARSEQQELRALVRQEPRPEQQV